MKLTVFFEGGFWVGVAEREVDGRYKACRHIFGAEPHDAEVLEFVRHRMIPLLERTHTELSAAPKPEWARVNPKRRAREASKETERRGAHDLAKAALMAELAHRKRTRNTVSREQREADKERKRLIAVEKAKAKHRGR